MKDGTTTEPLSAEAAAVMSRLPDLSFMHSKVLMFPVSDCANWADNQLSDICRVEQLEKLPLIEDQGQTNRITVNPALLHRP